MPEQGAFGFVDQQEFFDPFLQKHFWIVGRHLDPARLTRKNLRPFGQTITKEVGHLVEDGGQRRCGELDAHNCRNLGLEPMDGDGNSGRRLYP